VKTMLRLSIALVALVLFAAIALAGSVYGRATVALSTTAGTATWTNTAPYAALSLKRIWVERALYATDTVTVQRVTSDNVYTQTVGSVTCSAGSGSTASFTAAYLANGDKLTFTSGTTTGSTAIVEYEQQEH